MKSNKEYIEDTKNLSKENETLQQKLREAQLTIDLIRSGNIDALVDIDKNELKVYSDKTADKIYRILIEKMHEGAITLNETGTILYCNSSFASMVNLPLQKVIGTQFGNFIADASKGQYDTLFKQGWKLSAVKDEIHLNANNNIVMPVLISANTFEVDNNLFLSVILTDVTTRNKTQAELTLKSSQLVQKYAELESINIALTFQNEEREKRAAELSIANKELVFQIQEKKKRAIELKTAHIDVKDLEELVAHKDSILAILSHDLRSPLGGIIGTADYLKSNFQEMEDVDIKEMLDLLYESSTKELNMLDYLVEWARIKYASDVFSPKKIELVQYVKKVFDTLKETAALSTVYLHQGIEENISVFADEKMLFSILQNIVSNAIKHSRLDGKITISAKRNDDEIIVEIKDNGIGMSTDIQKNLFTPQMGTLSKERKDNKGAGIGLLLVKGFLEKNGGRIWVESTEGMGSSFYFTLPINKPLDKTTSIETEL